MNVNPSKSFAVCLNNEHYLAALEVGKIYRVIPSAEIEVSGLIQVIDESGEAYAFSTDRFHPIELPANIEDILLAAY